MRRLVTQKEIDDLLPGTKVRVTWDGGNGPHYYLVAKFKGLSFAVSEMSDEFPASVRLLIEGPGVNEIYFLGPPESPLTPQEKEILECMAYAWADSEDMSLYGGLSYQSAADFLTRMGVDHPTRLTRLMSAQAPETTSTTK